MTGWPHTPLPLSFTPTGIWAGRATQLSAVRRSTGACAARIKPNPSIHPISLRPKSSPGSGHIDAQRQADFWNLRVDRGIRKRIDQRSRAFRNRLGQIAGEDPWTPACDGGRSQDRRVARERAIVGRDLWSIEGISKGTAQPAFAGLPKNVPIVEPATC
jgi:hypothetical protein